ncbi:MAG: NAD-dependent epimerase/dehydratase family protein [Lachnospiraceae bacterium]|nr:NAD-dependent epimerase/dehydratase family protein [Lachnospiraceae bacterium]
MPKKVLITGGSGFIGRNVFEHLKDNPQFEVMAPDSKELNCIEENEVKDYLKKNNFDLVLNFAVYGDGIDKSKDGTKILDYNLRMYYNFARYSDMYGKMIYAGSGAEYDKRFPIIDVKEEDLKDRWMPSDQYGLMKRIVGEHIEASDNIYNFRLFGIFGKYEYYPLKFISNVCCKSIFDLPLSIRQDVYFDYLWIDDFLSILDRFLEIDVPKYHTYNVCHGEKILLSDICKTVNKISNKDNRIIICKEGLANEYTGSSNRIVKELQGFDFTGYYDSIEQLYKWYYDNKNEIEIYKLLY